MRLTRESIGHAIAENLPDRFVVRQAVEDDPEELSKWTRAMKRCQQTLADSARFAAWHNVKPLALVSLQLAPCFNRE